MFHFSVFEISSKMYCKNMYYFRDKLNNILVKNGTENYKNIKAPFSKRKKAAFRSHIYSVMFKSWGLATGICAI